MFELAIGFPGNHIDRFDYKKSLVDVSEYEDGVLIDSFRWYGEIYLVTDKGLIDIHIHDNSSGSDKFQIFFERDTPFKVDGNKRVLDERLDISSVMYRDWMGGEKNAIFIDYSLVEPFIDYKGIVTKNGDLFHDFQIVGDKSNVRFVTPLRDEKGEGLYVQELLVGNNRNVLYDDNRKSGINSHRKLSEFMELNELMALVDLFDEDLIVREDFSAMKLKIDWITDATKEITKVKKFEDQVIDIISQSKDKESILENPKVNKMLLNEVSSNIQTRKGSKLIKGN